MHTVREHTRGKQDESEMMHVLLFCEGHVLTYGLAVPGVSVWSLDRRLCL